MADPELHQRLLAEQTPRAAAYRAIVAAAEAKAPAPSNLALLADAASKASPAGAQNIIVDLAKIGAIGVESHPGIRIFTVLALGLATAPGGRSVANYRPDLRPNPEVSLGGARRPDLASLTYAPDRTPCPVCATRADVGCNHQRVAA